MKDEVSVCADIQTAMFDAVCDAISAAIVIYDRNDRIIFINSRVPAHLPVPDLKLGIGTRLRDLLAALYDSRREVDGPSIAHNIERDEWIAEQLSSHWKERLETV